ncbi:alanine/glycine:cation symporter family protein [Rhodopirellula halodulae]|uniref:alanine/glycine:cation symporter family protein n=1 Tax=Rhodopirellula halodulae TaxID=2894198 RepID=UPI001E64BCC6|nr:alanine/glycine:cation symporter family protein [Rhodopirellula sp. JC737]MCC9654233.1 alanine:cation symporter family protein [Rhodopirellula sp. JC737]
MLLSKLARSSWLRIVTLSVAIAFVGGGAAFGQDEVASEDIVTETSEPATTAADPTEEATAEAIGFDQQVDDLFRPVADTWGGFVFWGIELPYAGELPIVLLLLVGGAMFFTLAFGFINLRLFPLAIEVVSGKYDDIEKAGQDIPKGVEVMEVDGDLVDTIRDEGEGEVSHFQALATAVSGTVGLGNIAGVAVAIATGGPGATFWMIVCGLLGMSTKFVECTLGVKYRDVDENGIVHGGPMYYLKKGLAERGMAPVGKVFGVLFAIFCIGGSFGGGNAFQSNQAAQQIKSLLSLPDTGAAGTIIGLVMAALVAIVIIGGIKRIAKVTEKVVPLMALMYVIAALGIILMHIQSVPWAIGQVISGAFTMEAGIGGLIGVMVQGFRRAAFSNEAGAGSAAIAHSAVKTRYPASEGIVALLEPFIDTVVICTMTAIVIVLFNADGAFEWGQVESGTVLMEGVRLGGVDLTSAAFDSVLPGFRYLLTIAIILFAFSTMISWSYYGLQSWKYLFGRSQAADLSYKLLFCIVVVIGAAASLGSVIEFSDAMIFAMVFPNMIGLFLLFPKVREELQAYLKACGKS